MPYLLHWKPHGVVKHFTGFVSGAEFVQSVVDVTGNSQFDDLQFIINDFLDADDHGITRESLLDIVVLRLGASLTRNGIRTIITTTAPKFEEIAHVVNADLPDGVPRTVVFPTMPIATEWLAQQPPLTSLPLRRSF